MSSLSDDSQDLYVLMSSQEIKAIQNTADLSTGVNQVVGDTVNGLCPKPEFSGAVLSVMASYFGAFGQVIANADRGAGMKLLPSRAPCFFRKGFDMVFNTRVPHFFPGQPNFDFSSFMFGGANAY